MNPNLMLRRLLLDPERWSEIEFKSDLPQPFSLRFSDSPLWIPLSVSPYHRLAFCLSPQKFFSVPVQIKPPQTLVSLISCLSTPDLHLCFTISSSQKFLRFLRFSAQKRLILAVRAFHTCHTNHTHLTTTTLLRHTHPKQTGPQQNTTHNIVMLTTSILTLASK